MVIVSDEDSGCWCIALTKAFLSLQADEPIQNPSSSELHASHELYIELHLQINGPKNPLLPPAVLLKLQLSNE